MYSDYLSQYKDLWAGRHAEKVSSTRYALFETGRTTQAATAMNKSDAIEWVATGHVKGQAYGVLGNPLKPFDMGTAK